MRLHTLLTAAQFVLLTAAVYFTLSVLLFAIGYWRGRLIALLSSKKDHRASNADVRRLMVGEAAIAAVIFAVAVVHLLRYGSPLDVLPLHVLQITSVVALLIAGQISNLTTSYVPAQRNVGYFLRVSQYPIALFLVLLSADPQFVSNSVHYWAVVIAYGLILINIIGGLAVTLPQLQEFISEDARHDDLLISANQLKALSPYLSSQQDDRTIQEAISQVQKAAHDAYLLLKAGKIQEADIPMLLAEEEVQYVQRIFTDRIRFSLLEELRSRLAQSKTDVIALSEEFEEAGIDSAGLGGIQEQIAASEAALLSVPDSLADTPGWLNTFSQMFDQIVETRTALRFYRNSNAGIDSVRLQVAHGLHIENVASMLEIATKDAASCRNVLNSNLNTFVQGKFTTHRELISGYASIQRTLREYRKQIALIETQISSLHHRIELIQGALEAYAPKICAPHETNTGAIVGVASARREDVSVSIDGTLLELPSDRVFSVQLGPSPAIYGFAIAGKRGGKAKLKFKISSSETPVERTVPITVVPTVAERARDAALIIPFCAILALPSIRFGLELRDAVALGAVAGAGIAVLVFLSRIRIRR